MLNVDYIILLYARDVEVTIYFAKKYCNFPVDCDSTVMEAERILKYAFGEIGYGRPSYTDGIFKRYLPKGIRIMRRQWGDSFQPINSFDRLKIHSFCRTLNLISKRGKYECTTPKCCCGEMVYSHMSDCYNCDECETTVTLDREKKVKGIYNITYVDICKYNNLTSVKGLLKQYKKGQLGGKIISDIIENK